MPAKRLTLIDRAQILSGIKRSESNRQIAADIGRCRSTIGREIVRNGGRTAYCPERAERRALRKRRRPKVSKLVDDPVLAADVQRRLEAKDSPMRISIELKAKGLAVSHETIYRSIQQRDGALKWGAHKHLRLRRKSRKPQGMNVSKYSSLGVIRSIHERPKEALDRTKVGHFEGDLIIGAMNRSALITVFDRASRYVWLGDVASKQADDVAAGLARLLARIPEHQRLSLTWDRGSELARHRELSTESNIDIYFCDPHSPWQRPTNENGNGSVRHHVGKGTNLKRFTPADLRHIESRINTLPRRIFNWNTAQTKYDQLVAMTG